ncbi:MAG: AAA family ATPase, partial [Bacteroidales bacterium]|nr:AAA family ATPase [Bacteroidales bacterium]
MMKKYPIGIQSFEKIITENYLYIDKTEFIYNLVNTGNIYFLSRPRRFGKSLLISTMEAYFLGEKELFKGLKIEKLEDKWVEYPVLHLDLNAKEFINRESVYRIIDRQLKFYEDKYNIETDSDDIDDRFIDLIIKIKEQTGRQVVVLVDEYDKPMQQVMRNAAMLN